jgi:acetate kinase
VLAAIRVHAVQTPEMPIFSHLASADSRVSAWVIPTNEERIIAGHTLAVWRT